MPSKKVQCKKCSKFMRSDNLKRHGELCHHSQVADHYPRNQKIQKLVNEIINDDVTPVEVSSSPLEQFDQNMPCRHQPHK